MNEKYERIINRPHHISVTKRRMPEIDRAAQFAPYAALSGFESEVNEEARLTEKRKNLDDYEIERLNEKLRLVLSLGAEICVCITHFVADERKAGGAYIESVGSVKSIDSYAGCVIFTDGRNIPINSIFDIEIL